MCLSRLIVSVLCFTTLGMAQDRSFVSSANASNQALLIAAANGLSGLDYDLEMLEKISTNTAYSFKVHKLIDDEASTDNAKAALTELARNTGSNGTLFFYFTGHGSKGSLYMGDQSHMTVADIRSGIEAGRVGLGAVERLIVMYDSCFSGSMVDPVRTFLPTPEVASVETANAIVEGLSARGDEANYWKKLFVFASSTADETSLASPTGSIFTKGLMQGFEETVKLKGNMAKLAELTKKYTVGHHPVERFVPASLAQEPLAANYTETH